EVLRGEIELLGGRGEKVVLAGMSQGMAAGLWALLFSPGRLGSSEIGEGWKGRGIGAFVGMCGWFPFADRVEELRRGPPGGQTTTTTAATAAGRGLGKEVPSLLLDIIRRDGDDQEVDASHDD